MNKPNSALGSDEFAAFLAAHRLPDDFRVTAENHYLPFVRTLRDGQPAGRPMLLGINGAQGTGKSTLADFVQVAANALFGWKSAVLSIDDFYLTRNERAALAKKLHPLFATRGVPGTHDIALLKSTLDSLAQLGANDELALPRFDKSIDDRAPRSGWPVVRGPLDLVILEGWCVGSRPQPAEDLEDPVNALERDEDPDAVWRSYANARLGAEYASVFAGLDRLLLLAAPSFDAVYRWRLEQEQKLATSARGFGAAVMSEQQVARFIRFYERLTRHNLETLRDVADVVMVLNEDHAVVTSKYRVTDA